MSLFLQPNDENSNILSNKTLVNDLKRKSGMSDHIEKSFLDVPREIFVTELLKPHAYEDRPLHDSETGLHVSAPHIYCTAVTELELVPGLSFLQIGSGSGYFQTIVSILLGSYGISHGVELSEAIVNHANKALEKWYEGKPDKVKACEMHFFHANGFLLNPQRNVHYDRIYLAAEAPKSSLQNFADLLAPGGILIGPFDGDFIKCRKNKFGNIDCENLLQVSFAPLIHPEGEDLLPDSRKIVISPGVWSPRKRSNSNSYMVQPTFRNACIAIFILANRANCFCAQLPIDGWHIVLSFCTRNWFEKQLSETDVLRRELIKEKMCRIAAEERSIRLERERDHAMMMCVYLQRTLADRRNRHRADPDILLSDDDESDREMSEYDSDNNNGEELI